MNKEKHNIPGSPLDEPGEKVIRDIQNQMNKKRENLQAGYRSVSGDYIQYDTSQGFSPRKFIHNASVKTGFFLFLAGILLAVLAWIASDGTIQMFLFILAAVISLTGTNQITSYINNCTTSDILSAQEKPKKKS